ncbi:MAG: hypothetical protein AVDCRST_MAG69-1657, partial [uncultured Solirubrobacteraceae bacterium]
EAGPGTGAAGVHAGVRARNVAAPVLGAADLPGRAGDLHPLRLPLPAARLEPGGGAPLPRPRGRLRDALLVPGEGHGAGADAAGSESL